MTVVHVNRPHGRSNYTPQSPILQSRQIVFLVVAEMAAVYLLDISHAILCLPQELSGLTFSSRALIGAPALIFYSCRSSPNKALWS